MKREPEAALATLGKPMKRQDVTDLIQSRKLAKGGVATAWMLHEMASRRVVPLALVFNSVNPIMAQGAALADLPMLAGFECDITAELKTGDEIELDPGARLLRIVKSLP